MPRAQPKSDVRTRLNAVHQRPDRTIQAPKSVQSAQSAVPAGKHEITKQVHRQIQIARHNEIQGPPSPLVGEGQGERGRRKAPDPIREIRGSPVLPTRG